MLETGIHGIQYNGERESSRNSNPATITGTARRRQANSWTKLSHRIRSSNIAKASSADTETMGHPCVSQHRRHHENTNEQINSPDPVFPQMALLHRSELVVGALMGKGAFCEVHELQDVRLKGNRIENMNKQLVHCFSKLSTKTHPHDTSRQEQKGARERLLRTCRSDIDDDDPDPKLHNSCRYVVKELKPSLAQDRGYKVFIHAAADLVMEFHILSRLSHPNIVQIVGGGKKMMTAGRANADAIAIPSDENFGQFMERGDFFIVLERLVGTLSQRIQHWKATDCCRHHNHDDPQTSWARGKSQADVVPLLQSRYIEKLRYSRDLAGALSYLHKNNFVFRDLKPDNIMFAPNGSIKLVDFGLCRDLPKNQESSSAQQCQSRVHREPVFKMSGVGTRRYMAPEVISGQCYNQKIDCYSWAMVFFEMLSLQKPFALYNREAHRILVCENGERPYITSDIPFDAHSLLRQAWVQDPCDRLSMHQIYDELGLIIDCAERQALTPLERSLKVVMEMADLLTFDESGNDLRASSSSTNKSVAELTTSTNTSASLTTASESPL